LSKAHAIYGPQQVSLFGKNKIQKVIKPEINWPKLQNKKDAGTSLY
jgi:hypothetical protein